MRSHHRHRFSGPIRILTLGLFVCTHKEQTILNVGGVQLMHATYAVLFVYQTNFFGHFLSRCATTEGLRSTCTRNMLTLVWIPIVCHYVHRIIISLCAMRRAPLPPELIFAVCCVDVVSEIAKYHAVFGGERSLLFVFLQVLLPVLSWYAALSGN